MTDDMSITEIDKIKHDKIEKAREFEKKVNEAVNVGQKLEDKVDKLYEKICEGPDCLEKRIEDKFGSIDEKVKKIEDRQSNFVCDKCGYIGVPALSSYCPNCGASIYEWTGDDGQPVRGWRHWMDRTK